MSSGIGFWKVEVDGSCEAAGNGTEIDGPIKFGRAIGVILGLLAYGCLIVLIALSTIKVKSTIRKATTFIMYGLAPLNFLLLVGLATDACRDPSSLGDQQLLTVSVTCNLASGGILAIVSSFLWIGAGLSLSKLTPCNDAGTEIEQSESKADQETLQDINLQSDKADNAQ